MLRASPFLLALALAAGCAPAAGPAPVTSPAAPSLAGSVAAPADPYRRCESAPEAEGCVAAVEAELMARSAGRVSRRGDTLLVRTDDSHAVPLVTDRAEADRYVGYRYRGRVEPLASSLVSVHFYEGGSYVLVSDATGDQTHLIGPPLPAPDGSRFAALGLDLEAGYDPNGVQLWRVTEHGPRLEWGLMGGESWGASDGVWRSPAVLEFTRHAVVPPNPEPVPQRMRLVVDGPGLRVEPVP